MRGLRAAIGFLTILPGAPRTPNSGLSKAPGWFPVVGLLLGMIIALPDGLFRLGHLVLRTRSVPDAGELQSLVIGVRELPFLPATATDSAGIWHGFLDGVPFHMTTTTGTGSTTVTWLGLVDGVPFLFEGVLLVALLALLTRGLHLDGFMDTCDALAGGHDRERRLELFRDPHVGAFSVIGVVLLLVVKCSSLAALPVESRLWTIVLVPCLSRWAILVVMDRFPYVRRDGLGTPFLRGGSRRSLAVGSAVAVLATVVLTGPVGLLLIAASGLVAGAVGAWAKRRIGGVTGDIYGAACETSEAAVLVLAVVITLVDPGALASPLLALLDIAA
ncbi:MAG: adenosylcobinamide-GDP ribazoletransferase [bacterium]|nr:adenosylcobinamide-GDP ribazoletransferase [bacterium]